MRAFYDLPPELYFLVGGYLAKRDAISVSRTSKHFYHWFRSTVWKSFYPRGRDAELMKGLWSLMRLAENEMKGPHAGRSFIHETN